MGFFISITHRSVVGKSVHMVCVHVALLVSCIYYAHDFCNLINTKFAHALLLAGVVAQLDWSWVYHLTPSTRLLVPLSLFSSLAPLSVTVLFLWLMVLILALKNIP